MSTKIRLYPRFNIETETASLQSILDNVESREQFKTDQKLRERIVLCRAVAFLRSKTHSFPISAEHQEPDTSGNIPDFKAWVQNDILWGYFEITDTPFAGYIAPKPNTPSDQMSLNRDEFAKNLKRKIGGNIVQQRDMPPDKAADFLSQVRNGICKKADRHNYPIDTTLIVYSRIADKCYAKYQFYIEENFGEIIQKEHNREPFVGLDKFKQVIVLSPSLNQGYIFASQY